MPYYECVFIARQDISAPQVDALADHFTKVVEDLGGTIGKREYWGLRTLSYRIRKNRKGHYVLFNIDAPPAAIEEIGRQMRINEDVIRHLTVRVDALNAGPSQIMLSRSSRGDERERDRDRPRRDERGERGGRERDDRDRGRSERGRGFGDDEGRGDGDEVMSTAQESEGEH